MPGCIPWLVRSLVAQRIAAKSRTAEPYQNRPETQAESSGCPQSVATSRGRRPLIPCRTRMPHARPRNAPARRIHPADHGHAPPDGNRPLSRMAVAKAGNMPSAPARQASRPAMDGPRAKTQRRKGRSHQTRSQYPDRTLEWMQPAPAYHGGPMVVRLCKPEMD